MTTKSTGHLKVVHQSTEAQQAEALIVYEFSEHIEVGGSSRDRQHRTEYKGEQGEFRGEYFSWKNAKQELERIPVYVYMIYENYVKKLENIKIAADRAAPKKLMVDHIALFAEHVANFTLGNPKVVSALTKAFAKAGLRFSLTPLSEPAETVPVPQSAPIPALPEAAPRLWADHDPSTNAASNLDGITAEQMQAWREVNAARSRAQRAQWSPEEAAYQSKEGTKRVAAHRERMTPEQREARSAKEAERLRRKRALGKDLEP